jgi:hypothetical protein
MYVLGCGNDCVMDKHVGRALDWLLCAIIAGLLVLPLEMPTKLKAIWGHIRWALAWLLMVLAEALRYSSPILPRMTGSYVFGV